MTMLSGALAAFLFFGNDAEPRTYNVELRGYEIPDSVKSQVCDDHSYTYDINNRKVEIGGETFYTSVSDRNTPSGRLLYLNAVGPEIKFMFALGYTGKDTDITKGGTYKLTPIEPKHLQESRNALESNVSEGDPVTVDVVNCK